MWVWELGRPPLTRIDVVRFLKPPIWTSTVLDELWSCHFNLMIKIQIEDESVGNLVMKWAHGFCETRIYH